MRRGKYVVIVPARRDSVRLPEKNIKPFNGVPLIAKTIRSAIQSQYVSRVVISSNDLRAIQIAREEGAHVPFVRPEELSAADTPSIAVIKHYLLNEPDVGNNIVLLQPTSPLRQTEHIDQAIQMFDQSDVDSLVSVGPLDHPSNWSVNVGEQNCAEGIASRLGDNSSSCSRYRLNGAIYINSVAQLLTDNNIFRDQPTLIYVMNRLSSIDIDFHEDFAIAEFIERSFPRMDLL